MEAPVLESTVEHLQHQKTNHLGLNIFIFIIILLYKIILKLPAAYLETTGKTFGGEIDLLVKDRVGLFIELLC